MRLLNTWTRGPLQRWPRVALLAILFSFFGILAVPSPAGTPHGTHVGVSRPTPNQSVSTIGTKPIDPPLGGFRVINRVSLDWRNDDPTQTGRTSDSVVASGCSLPACTYDIECDDGDRCTVDACAPTDPVGACTGTCNHTPVPAGQSGDCDDGLVCNGRETCDQNGQCVPGNPPHCCTDPGGGTVCSENAARCNANSANEGALCDSNSDCVGGTCDYCQPPCASNADCNDGVECNGIETCQAGVCMPSLNPCGLGADCAEGRCAGQGVVPCNKDGDCSALSGSPPCDLSLPFACFTGRCCTPDTGDPGDEMDCIDKRGLANTIGGQIACTTIAGSLWYAGDTGRDDNTDLCGGEDPNSVDEWGCPKYSFGIMQHVAAVPPYHGVAAGPISNSSASVASPNGPSGPLNRLGDDYVLSNTGYLGLDAIRWVGGVDAPGRLVVELRDAAGVLIEDALTPNLFPGLGVQVFAFTPSVTIPAAGFVTLRVASEYSPNLRFYWVSTNAANSVGANDGDLLWVNNAPAAGAQNFLGSGNGVLGLELVGDKEPPPIGACCDKSAGTCTDGVLPWTCAASGGVFSIGTTCLDFSACGLGACCDAGSGSCSQTTSGGCAGTFLGFGTTCDADAGLDAGLQHCCPQPSAMRCMDGPNNLDPCAADIDCGQCVGGAQASQPCDDAADCPDGSCIGRCLNRFAGADRCEDALVHVLSVPAPGGPPLVKTITGDDAPSGTISIADACASGRLSPPYDLGWYETFEINDCARVRIDFCCTEPTRVIGGEYLFPIEMPSGTCLCDEPILASPDPYIAGQGQSNFGAPFCPGGDFWVTFPLLSPGRYAYPIYSSATGPRGPYQMHITVEPCPLAACCHESCSGSGQPCDFHSPCPVGETCDGHCDELHQSACDALRGNWLGPPQVANTVTSCGTSGDACASGSCCTGPGVCQDNRNNSGNPMTQAECESRGGNFFGGVLCHGAHCLGNAACLNYSCSTSEDCCQPGSTCTGTPQEKAQPSPCPICEIEGLYHCQAYDGNTLGSLADPSFDTAHAVADDFIHGGGDIETICVWGVYLDLNPDSTAIDCEGSILSDQFRVRIYSDNNGLPGNLAAERTVVLSGPSWPRGKVGNTWVMNEGADIFQFQLALPTPITNLTAGACYWLEVVNDTGTSPIRCTWIWMRLESWSASGNRYAASGDAVYGYPPGSEVHWDQAFCLNTPFLPGGCGTREKVCCACGAQSVPPDPRCSQATLESCGDAGGDYQAPQNSCDGYSCPPSISNDACANAIDAAVGPYTFNTACASTDGINPIPDEGGWNDVVNDLWYHFVVPNDPSVPDELESHDLVFSLCGTGAPADGSEDLDTIIAVYKDPSNFGVCPCPTNSATAEATFLIGRDENCYKMPAGGPAFVDTRDALPGECYTVRVGGFGSGVNERGRGTLNISAGPAFCGDNRRNGNPLEECDGTDTPAGFDCTSDCITLLSFTCGDGIITGNEECDPNCFNCNTHPGQTFNGCYTGSTCIPGSGPGHCTCTPSCGNGHVENGEGCDGMDDDACPGQCGQPGGDPADDCKCPVPVCGNNIVDAGEECDGLENPCQAGNCRPPGDPFGGCTCACEAICRTCGCFLSWPADPLSNLRATRSLTFSPTCSPANALPFSSALQIRMVDLVNPNPPGPLCCPPPNFSTFEAANCTAVGEQNSCSRWVGPPTTFYESASNPALGSFRGARLQCTPFYYDWATEPLITVIGAEIVPSSTYELRQFDSICKGSEAGCTSVGPPVTILTRRWGDVASSYNPPATTVQPDALDIVALVNKFRNVPGAPSKRGAQIQPNSPEFNTDLNALDIVATVDAFRGLQYPYSGPCACPSAVTCNSTPCTSPANCGSGMCVKTCAGGTNASQPCVTDMNCPGGTCGSGFCRDRCGRCN